jgi:hypothetical protein
LLGFGLSTAKLKCDVSFLGQHDKAAPHCFRAYRVAGHLGWRPQPSGFVSGQIRRWPGPYNV